MSSRGSRWASLRAQAWWVQALVWVFALPVAVIVWASARRSLRRTSLGAAVALASCCVLVPLGRGVDEPAAIEVRAANDARSSDSTRSSTSVESTVATTAPPPTAPPSTAAPTTVPPTTAPPTTVPAGVAPTTAPPAAPSARTRAETLLSQVSVAEEVERSGYDRDLFEHWIDADGNGCNTRCEVLLRQQLPGGGWFSIYDRTTVPNSSDLDVDHVVALAEAWRSGAWGWDPARRRAFANDLDEPRSLVAVTASSNRSKSDRDPTGWRPGAEADWCEYAVSWMTVKLKWELSVDREEFTALQHLTERC